MEKIVTAPRKASPEKKTKPATRLTRNDRQVLKRAHILPRGKHIKSETSRKENENEPVER